MRSLVRSRFSPLLKLCTAPRSDCDWKAARFATTLEKRPRHPSSTVSVLTGCRSEPAMLKAGVALRTCRPMSGSSKPWLYDR